MDIEAATTRLLLIEDNPADAALLKEQISIGIESTHEHFQLEHETTVAAGVRRALTEPYDLILLDLNLPDSTGIETALRVRAAQPDVPVVVLTGMEDETLGMQAIQAGVQDYLLKGELDARLLARTVRYSRVRKRLEEDLRKANEILERRVGQRTEELERSVTMLGEELSKTGDLRAQARDPLREALQELPDAMFVLSGDLSSLVYCNRVFRRLCRLDDQANAQPMCWLAVADAESREQVRQMLSRWLTDNQREPIIRTMKVSHTDGLADLVEARLLPVVIEGRLAYVCGIIRPSPEATAEQRSKWRRFLTRRT